MNKILFSLLPLLLSTQVSAATGFYVGLDGGADVNGWRGTDNLNKKISFASHGVIGRAALGFGLGEEFYYFALEAFGEDATNKSQVRNMNAATTQRRIDRSYGYGVAFMPGINLSGSLLYGRIGYVKARFGIHDSFVNAGTDRPLLNGYQLGIGVQSALNENMDMRSEFLYYKYHSYTNINGTFDPRETILTLGVIYRFC